MHKLKLKLLNINVVQILHDHDWLAGLKSIEAVNPLQK